MDQREATYREVAEILELPLDDTDNGQLQSYLRVKGFSPSLAFDVTDKLGAYRLADLKYVSMHDIDFYLDDLEKWERQLLVDCCNGARKYYGMPTLEPDSRPTGSCSANPLSSYLVAYKE